MHSIPGGVPITHGKRHFSICSYIYIFALPSLSFHFYLSILKSKRESTECNFFLLPWRRSDTRFFRVCFLSCTLFVTPSTEIIILSSRLYMSFLWSIVIDVARKVFLFYVFIFNNYYLRVQVKGKRVVYIIYSFFFFQKKFRSCKILIS